MPDWADSSTIAELTGLTERAVRKALRAGRLWKQSIVTREITGRGGKSGVHLEVRVDSLPLGLQERLKASSQPAEPRTFKTKGEASMSLLDRMFAEADRHKDGTVGQKDVFRKWAKRELLDFKGAGALRRYSAGTLSRYYKEYKKLGFVAVMRKTRSDNATVKAVVTTKFDAWAKPLGLELEPIEKRLRDYIRAQHKNHEGESNIRFKAGRMLEKIARELGHEPPPGVCGVPLHIVKGESVYRRVGEFHKDRKRFEDDRPGIRRTIEGLEPMDVVIGDVHPLDFLLPEVEGFQRYAKAICWFDVATARLWMTVVFLPKGEGIRNEHVIASFMDMATDWGLPKKLYLDNGSEYGFADFIVDALKLTRADYLKALTRAKAYNARAKVIENRFAVLRHYFAKLPGYVGGDRMKSKVANVGKAPVAYGGSHAQFREMNEVGVLSQYHNMPQRGALAGRSPLEVYNAAVAAGWHKTEVDEDAFFTAFSIEETRHVKQGRVSVGGRFWTCDALASYLGERVVVLIPKFEHWDRLPIKDERGRLLGFAEVDRKFGFLDEGGAKESGRRGALRLAAVRELDASAATIDAEAELMELAREAPKALPAPIGARVTASDERRAIAKGVKESPKAKREREDAARRREAEEQRALSAEFFEKIAARKAKNA